MKTLYCHLGKSTEHRTDAHIQQMMSHQTHFVLMAMVAPLRKLLTYVIGCDHRIKNFANMLLLESLREFEHLLLMKFILSNYGNHFAEAVTQSCSGKKVSEACKFIKKESLAQVFSCEFPKNIFFMEHLW